MGHLPIKDELLSDVEHCDMCGAVLIDGVPDREEYADVEIVRRLARLMSDDWKAAAVMLIYTDNPNATISFISEKIRIGRTEICEARDRAAAMFPELAPVLALRTPRAVSQRERRFEERQEGETTPDLF